MRVNLYDPHQDPPKNFGPGPGEYFTHKPDPRNRTAIGGFKTVASENRKKVNKPEGTGNYFKSINLNTSPITSFLR